MTSRIIFIGGRESGKSTLIAKVQKTNVIVQKTQSVEKKGCFIDTPGEFLEIPTFHRALILSSYDADLVVLIQPADEKMTYFPPRFAAVFNKKTIGIVTKSDLGTDEDLQKAEELLKQANAEEVFHVSVKDEESIIRLEKYLIDYFTSIGKKSIYI